MQRASHHAPIELQRRHRAFMLASNEALQSIGGVNYLPVVDVLPGGGTYVIAVPSVHDGPVEAGLTALVRDQRYGVQMQCFEKISDQAGARALYSPWIAALALEALP